jgi:phospholipase/carboxylesterase
MYKPDLPKNAGPVEWIGPNHSFLNLSGLVHCVRLPKEASLKNPAPVVVMLHGWGGDECAMWLFKRVVPAIAAIITPRAPIEFEHGSFIWFKYLNSGRQPDPASLHDSLAKLKHFLTVLPDVYPIDSDRLVLLGFSQGAAISNSLVLTQFRQNIAGLVSLSSFIPDLPELSDQIDSLNSLPVFITHGTCDEIVPVERARHGRDLYTRLKADITYREYSTGHKVHTDGMKALKQWLRDILCEPTSGDYDQDCDPDPF